MKFNGAPMYNGITLGWAILSLLSCASVTSKLPASGVVVAATRAKIDVVGHASPPVRMFSEYRTPAQAMFLFADRDLKANEKLPVILHEKLYYELSMAKAQTYRVRESGEVFALAPVSDAGSQSRALERAGFQRLSEIEPFALFGTDSGGAVGVFRRQAVKDETFELPAGAILAGFEVDRAPRSGELLYNGIRLPREWPPRRDIWSSSAPMPVPYLEHPPELIPIEVGRQLFVDDFLIAESTFEREFHLPRKFEGNPVLKPETEIEKSGLNNLAVAGPKSGGLWWNPEKQLFELWYEAGWVSTIAYATSKDGVHWERPDLPLRPGTNQVLPTEVKPDSWTVVRDYRSTDPRKAFKIFLRGEGTRDEAGVRHRARYFMSADGIDWGEPHEAGITGDRSTMFYNAFRKKWVFSLRWRKTGSRARAYWEADDFETGMRWLPDEPVPWVRTDRLDPPDSRIGNRPELYNLDAVPYESILLGCFEIFHGPGNDVNAAKGLPKNTGLNFAYSRDGFHWHRPDRRMAINSEQRDAWDRGYVQSLGNLCTVRGDKLWFYYIGFAGDPKVKLGDPAVGTASMRSGMYANGATGIAFLRRDGFASLNAGTQGGTMTTRPLTFSGRHLFVNLEAPQGSLRAEVVDMHGAVVPPFTLANCLPLTGDTTLGQLRWKGGDDLARLAHRPVRFRFQLQSGKLYSFWVSRDESGRSDGYVAGGGPGFTCEVDTVGREALAAEARRRPR